MNILVRNKIVELNIPRDSQFATVEHTLTLNPD